LRQFRAGHWARKTLARSSPGRTGDFLSAEIRTKKKRKKEKKEKWKKTAIERRRKEERKSETAAASWI